jgi:hypothetical protein
LKVVQILFVIAQLMLFPLHIFGCCWFSKKISFSKNSPYSEGSALSNAIYHFLFYKYPVSYCSIWTGPAKTKIWSHIPCKDNSLQRLHWEPHISVKS